MTPEQELRLECLSLAVEAGAGPDCALDVAADFEAYVRDGEPPDSEDGDDPDGDDDECDEATFRQLLDDRMRKFRAEAALSRS